MVDAAKGHHHGHRDATMILVAYRHGLRVSGFVDVRSVRIGSTFTATLRVRRNRARRGHPSHHRR